MSNFADVIMNQDIETLGVLKLIDISKTEDYKRIIYDSEIY